MHDFAKPMHDFAKLFSIYIPNFAISFTIDIAKWQFLTTHHRVMAVNARNLLPSLEFYITRGQLNRRIKAELGITAQQLSLQVRMNHAKQLLLTNDELTVADVAFQCGFEDATSFSRAFHRAFSMSPTEFRNNQIE